MGGHVQRAAQNPDKLTFESEVIDVDGPFVRLAETYFFAESGGQPPDRGELGGEDVIDVQFGTDGIVHELASEPSVAVGDRIHGEIDPTYRRYCRRAHTASHVLYGAARREVEGLGYGGFEIGDRKIRVDLEAEEPIDEETVLSLERRSNEVVWDSRDVTWTEIPRERAERSEDIAFNAATEEVFAETETVRIVDVAGWDRAACGGTHLRNTAEIGPVCVLDRSNPGRGLTRVEFAVGPAAIDTQTAIHRAATTAARRLDTMPEQLLDAVAAMQETIDEQESRLESLERTVLEERLHRFDTREIDGVVWRIGHIPNTDASLVTAILREAIEEGRGNVLVGLSGAERTAVTVATDGTIAAEDVLERITEEFGGGGGGSRSIAQGGGIPDSPEAVERYVDREVMTDMSAS